jgi:hypothetical protein
MFDAPEIKRGQLDFQKGPVGIKRGQYPPPHRNRSKIWNSL